MDWLNLVRDVVEVLIPLLIGIFGGKYHEKRKQRKKY